MIRRVINVPRLCRRSLLGLGAAILSGPVRSAPSATFGDRATLLVAGPEGGVVDGWADWLSPALVRALPSGTEVTKSVAGGADGVTGANQFDARAVPDGATALLLPGSAALAWLVGDPRARFDAARWIPLLAGIGSGVIASRVPLRQVIAGAPVRIAATGPAGEDLAALLALELIGARWQPVFGPRAEAASCGNADMMFLHGRNVAEDARTLAACGMPPILSLAVPDEDSRVRRDPAFASLPAATDLLTTGSDGLRAAWRACAIAATLDVALVLPPLTPAAVVAVWRRACTQVAPAVQPLAEAVGVRPLVTAAATAATSAAIPDAAALLELRRWLAVRLDYRPA